MSDHGIGASIRRKEDYRFLTGNGHYLDDMVLPRQAYACFVRSPHAHATINGIDTAAASAAPGVVGVFTGKDLEADGVNPLICGWGITDKNGKPFERESRFTNVWVLKDGAWQCVSGHAAAIPTRP